MGMSRLTLTRVMLILMVATNSLAVTQGADEGNPGTDIYFNIFRYITNQIAGQTNKNCNIPKLKLFSSALIQEVKDRLDDLGKAYSSGDITAVEDMFTDDLQFMPPGTKLIDTKAGMSCMLL